MKQTIDLLKLVDAGMSMKEAEKVHDFLTKLRKKRKNKKPKKESTRARKWVGILSNHVSRDDDDMVEVSAKTYAEAEEKVLAKMDKSRFSLRAVMTAKEARSTWA